MVPSPTPASLPAVAPRCWWHSLAAPGSRRHSAICLEGLRCQWLSLWAVPRAAGLAAGCLSSALTSTRAPGVSLPPDPGSQGEGV